MTCLDKLQFNVTADKSLNRQTYKYGLKFIGLVECSLSFFILFPILLRASTFLTIVFPRLGVQGEQKCYSTRRSNNSARMFEVFKLTSSFKCTQEKTPAVYFWQFLCVAAWASDDQMNKRMELKQGSTAGKWGDFRAAGRGGDSRVRISFFVFLVRWNTAGGE